MIVNGEVSNYKGKNIIIDDSSKGMIYYVYDNNEVIGLKYTDSNYIVGWY